MTYLYAVIFHPHVSRSRDTCHVIQVFEIPLSCNVGLMMFTTKHVIYKAKVCFRGLLVCWHFPALTWVGQGPHIMWFSHCNMHIYLDDISRINDCTKRKCIIVYSDDILLIAQSVSELEILFKRLAKSNQYTAHVFCFRGLLVCWHFPLLTWVGHEPLVMWFRQPKHMMLMLRHTVTHKSNNITKVTFIIIIIISSSSSISLIL